MDFLGSLDLFGVDTKEIPCITGPGAPTTATEGAVGCFYMDTGTGDVYKCTAVAGNAYTWLRNDGTPDSVTYTPQNLTPEQQAQARENIGAVAKSEFTELHGLIQQNTEAIKLLMCGRDVHAEYFQITEDGVVSLKAEYRGATSQPTYGASISDNGVGIEGSKNAELPQYLFIPDIVNGITVNSLADGMFCDNTGIEYVVLPDTITAIPTYCFYKALYVKEIFNTEHITMIAVRGLNYCNSLIRAKFPNLTSVGSMAFCGCQDMVYADVGNITECPDYLFMHCNNLQYLKNAGNITAIGKAAFFRATELSNFLNIERITSIGSSGFIGTDIDYDTWSRLESCNLGANAIPSQINPNDYWSDCTFTPCGQDVAERVPTYMSQNRSDVSSKIVGASIGYPSTLAYNKYGNGCALLASMMAYCGLNNIKCSTVEELEALFITNAQKKWLQEEYSNESNNECFVRFAEVMGLTAHAYYSPSEIITHADGSKTTVLQAIYDALAKGDYVWLWTSSGGSNVYGHIILAYGVADNGEILFVDPSSREWRDEMKPYTFSCFYQNHIAEEVYVSEPGKEVSIIIYSKGEKQQDTR